MYVHVHVLLYIGPDRPNVTVPKVVVAGIHQSVKVSCSVQETADFGENSQFELEWKGVSEQIHTIHIIWCIQHGYFTSAK